MARTEEEVQIIVSARNEASKALNAVERDMGSLAKKAGGFGAAMSTAIGVFTGGAALDLAAKGISAVTGIVTDGIQGAKDAALAYAQLAAGVESTGGAAGLTAQELSDLASDLSLAEGASTFADDQIAAFESILLTFTNVKGEIFKEATGLGTDLATRFSMEPAAAAQTLGKALQDPVKGISALTRVGITFTKQQQDQIKAMAEAGDMAGAQRVILAELETQVGGSAKAAADAAGPWAQMTEVFGEFTEEIGALVLPLINKVGRALLGGPLQQAFKAIIPLISIVVDSFITLGQALTGNWEDAAEGIVPFHRLIGNLALTIREMFQAFQTGGLEGFISLYLEKLETAVPLIVETLAGWGAAFLDWIGPMIPKFWTRLGGILEIVLTWIGEQVPSIAAKLLEWGIAFSQWIGERIPIIMEELGKLLNSLLNWMRDHKEEINAKLQEWADLFGAWVMTDAWPFMQKELAKLLIEFTLWIADQVADLTIAAVAWGTGIDAGILQGIKDNWWKIVAWIGSQLRKIPGFDLLMGTGGASSGTGGGSGPFAAPMGLAAAGGAGIVSGVSVPRIAPVSMAGVKATGGIVAATTVSITVDARGASDPYAIEQAGYAGAKRALQELSTARIGKKSVANLRLALDQLGAR